MDAPDDFAVFAFVTEVMPTPTVSFFFLASSLAARIRRTPGASVATGFSMNTCLPALTAASYCIGRNPGGVQSSTTSTPQVMAFS